LLYTLLVCLDLPQIDFATLTPASAGLEPSPIGTVATYTCDPGFYVDGTGLTSFALTCQSTASTPNWDPNNLPECTQGKMHSS